jgi:hypothetical protein
MDGWVVFAKRNYDLQVKNPKKTRYTSQILLAFISHILDLVFEGRAAPLFNVTANLAD